VSQKPKENLKSNGNKEELNEPDYDKRKEHIQEGQEQEPMQRTSTTATINEVF
jgi:hypothetical protein